MASNIQIEGLDQAFRDLKRMHKEVTARRIVLSSLRAAVKAGRGLETTQRLTPVGDKPHVSARRATSLGQALGFKKSTGTVIQPGNLRRSVKIFSGKSKDFPNVQVGFQTGSNNRGGKPDGWYGYFVNEGLGKGNRQPKNIFERALNITEPAIAKSFEGKLLASVERRKKKYGFR